jgi:hypothetical protein
MADCVVSGIAISGLILICVYLCKNKCTCNDELPEDGTYVRFTGEENQKRVAENDSHPNTYYNPVYHHPL